MSQTLVDALKETLMMLLISGILSVVLGFLLGCYVYATKKQALYYQPTVHKLLTLFLTIFNSLPFVIIMVALIPLNRWLNLGQWSLQMAILPLTLTCIPIFAKHASIAFLKTNEGLLDLASSLGANRLQMIRHFVLPEAMPQLIEATKHLLVRLLAFSLIAGIIGAGGLGQYLFENGLQRNHEQTLFAVFLIVVLVAAIIQLAFDFFKPSKEEHAT